MDDVDGRGGLSRHGERRRPDAIMSYVGVREREAGDLDGKTRAEHGRELYIRRSRLCAGRGCPCCLVARECRVVRRYRRVIAAR